MITDRALFGALFFTYAYFFQGGFDNQNSRFDASLAIAFEHRLAIDSFAQNTIDKAEIDGHFYCEKSPATTLLALPVALLATTLTSVERIQQKGGVGNVLLYLATLCLSACVAFAAVCFRRTLSLLNPEQALATAITLSVFVATLLLPYATLLMGHALAASLLTIGVWCGLAKKPLYAGLAFGAAVFSEFPDAPLAIFGFVAVLGFLPANERRPAASRMITGGAAWGLVLAAYNTIAFGAPWKLGYASLGKTPFTQTMAKGFVGITLPRISVMWQLLAGEYRGLFVYSPLLLLAVASLWFWPRTLARRVALPLMLGAFALIVLQSGYGYWQGGVAYGPRHLVSAIPFIALGFAFLPSQKALIAFSIPSLALALVGTVLTPFVDEFDLTPLRNSYWSLLKQAAVSANPRNFMTSGTDARLHWLMPDKYPWASFNLGELFGFSGYWSLVPLLVFWILLLRSRH